MPLTLADAPAPDAAAAAAIDLVGSAAQAHGGTGGDPGDAGHSAVRINGFFQNDGTLQRVEEETAVVTGAGKAQSAEAGFGGLAVRVAGETLDRRGDFEVHGRGAVRHIEGDVIHGDKGAEALLQLPDRDGGLRI